MINTPVARGCLMVATAVVAVSLVACGTRSSPFDRSARPLDQRELDDATEIALRHVLKSDSWGAVDYLCLGATPMTAVGPSNPPAALFNRLAGHRPPVVRASSCEVTPQEVRHRTTRTPAQLFLIEGARWRGTNEVVVTVRAFVSRMNDRRSSCTVVREPDSDWKLGRCQARIGP